MAVLCGGFGRGSAEEEEKEEEEKKGFVPVGEGDPPGIGYPTHPPPAMAMEEEGGQPGFRWDNWKAWAALSVAEFAIILILAAGLAHLAIQQEGDDWPDGGMLSPLQRANHTIQVTAKRWESCRNHTRMLQANTSNLTSQVAELNARLRLKELENKVLEDELALLKNWTQKLQDLINRQKEAIIHLQQQQLINNCGHQVYLHLGLTSMLLATIVTFQV